MQHMYCKKIINMDHESSRIMLQIGESTGFYEG